MAWLAAIHRGTRAATDLGGLYLRTSLKRYRPVSEFASQWRLCEHRITNTCSCAFMHTSSGWNQQPGHLDQGPTTPPPRPPTLESLAGGKKIRVTWSDGEESTYHAVWLRHNCRCPKCWGESSDQKLVSSFGGTDELQPDEMIVSSVRSTSDANQLEISWSLSEGTHMGCVDLPWLRRNSYSPAALDGSYQKNKEFGVAESLPRVDYAEVSEGERGLWSWLRPLNEYGVCLLTNVPTTGDKVRELANSAGLIQRTLHGEIFEVMADSSEKSSHNIAYSTRELPLHMDLIYMDNPPGLQFFHCIRNDNCIEGGESVLLDVLPIVEKLRREFPEHFDTLTRVPVTLERIHYRGGNPLAMRCRKPLIVLDNRGLVTETYWDPTVVGPLLAPEADIEPFYEAYHCLGKLFQESELKLVHKLNPGETLTFNNRRMLHSRTGFTLNGGTRYFQGAYVSIGDFKSKVRILASKFSPSYNVKTVL